MALVVKNPPACAGYLRHGCDHWVRKILWRRAWQPTPVFLPGESPWTGGLQSIGLWRIEHNWSKLAHMHRSHWIKIKVFPSIALGKSTSMLIQMLAEFTSLTSSQHRAFLSSRDLLLVPVCRFLHLRTSHWTSNLSHIYHLSHLLTHLLLPF